MNIAISPFPHDLKYHRQNKYIANPFAFRTIRLNYYSSRYQASVQDCKNLLLCGLSSMRGSLTNLYKAFLKLERFRAEIVIITAHASRLELLARLKHSIECQSAFGTVLWIIVDNGSPPVVRRALGKWSKTESWIVVLSYRTPFGYAAPARNHGLALAYAGLAGHYTDPFVMVIDSDDYIAHFDSLKELRFAKARLRWPSGLIHGYCTTLDPQSNITTGTIPRGLTASFPAVRKMSEEFDEGPPLLAGGIRASQIGDFLYPDEYTFEDDTLCRRMILRFNKLRYCGVAVNYPIIVKTFHEQSMSAKNQLLGDHSLADYLGAAKVTGVRALMVKRLKEMRDYFLNEEI